MPLASRWPEELWWPQSDFSCGISLFHIKIHHKGPFLSSHYKQAWWNSVNNSMIKLFHLKLELIFIEDFQNRKEETEFNWQQRTSQNFDFQQLHGGLYAWCMQAGWNIAFNTLQHTSRYFWGDSLSLLFFKKKKRVMLPEQPNATAYYGCYEQLF